MAGLQMSFTMATDDPQVVLSNFKDKCIRLIDNFADKCCLKDKKVGSLGLTLKHMSVGRRAIGEHSLLTHRNAR
jgi:hypothetical protein